VILAVTLLLFLLPGVALAAAIVMLLITLSLIVLFLGLLFEDRITLNRVRLAIAGGLVLSCLVLNFANAYYTESSQRLHAFSKPLNRLDAVYFSIGVMSTSGTNGVEARSATAEAELALQQAVDVTAVTLLVGGLTGRLGRRRNAAKRSRRAGAQSHTLTYPSADTAAGAVRGLPLGGASANSTTRTRRADKRVVAAQTPQPSSQNTVPRRSHASIKTPLRRADEQQGGLDVRAASHHNASQRRKS
jgi:hypothetical protein